MTVGGRLDGIGLGLMTGLELGVIACLQFFRFGLGTTKQTFFKVVVYVSQIEIACSCLGQLKWLSSFTLPARGTLQIKQWS